MILKQIRVVASNDITTNSYIISNENESMVIDPGGEPEKVIEMLETIEAKPKYILLTHCHADHIGGVKEIKERYNSKVLISRIDSSGVNEESRNLAPFIGIQIPEVEVDSRLDDGDLIHVGNLEFKIISTPGHTSGGISVYCEQEKLLFSGDTLFSGSCGRTDLPTSSHEAIINSIKNRLLKLPIDTVVYPGHGRPTTIKDEKELY